MSVEHTAVVPLTICGVERMVCVVFEVESYGSSGGWGEPPEGPSIVINDVRNDDDDGRSIYDLCEQCRDIWAAPRYVSGVWQVQSFAPAINPYTGTRSPAYAYIGFNAHYGRFHSLLDTLYEVVVDKHMPEYEPSDDDVCLGSVYYGDTRGEYDV